MKETNKEYAEALFLIACEKDCVREYSDCLCGIETLINENPGYLKVLGSPAIPLGERLSLIEESFSASVPEEIVSFLKILCENGRIFGLCECIDEFHNLVKIMQNRTKATVYYVSPLSDEQKEKLLQKLGNISGKTVEAEYIKDESLIGGIKVQLGDKLFDGSLSGKIHKVKGVISE